MNVTGGIRRLAAVLSVIGVTALMSGCSGQFAVLDPKGIVGRQQLHLMVISTLLCLVVIVPVLVLAFVIAWRYRNKPDSKASYKPEWEHSTKLEILWWGVPILVILVLGIITAQYTYKLEPSKPLQSATKPIVIQVTSLDWKWLFQYPEQGIATVNYVEFPAGVPVRFELTSDAPMNSFWIPQLGGQIYTMSGMAMKLNLMADEPGTYMGSGANFSGKDFAKMRFDAKAVTQADFDKWAARVKSESTPLTQTVYDQLAKPGVVQGTADYSSIPPGLFEHIVTKYGGGHHHMPVVTENSPIVKSDGGASPSPMPSMPGMNMDQGNSAANTTQDHH